MKYGLNEISSKKEFENKLDSAISDMEREIVDKTRRVKELIREVGMDSPQTV